MAEQHLNVEAYVDVLLDENTFQASGSRSSAAIAGRGEIFGRTVLVHASGGSALEAADYLAVSELYREAAQTGCPIVRIFHSPGAKLSPNILAAQEAMMREIRACSQRSPSLAIVVGTAIGVDAIAASLHDFKVMVRRNSAVCISGPSVIFPVSNDDISLEDLAGADIHARTTGLCDIEAGNDVEALLAARRIVSVLPASGTVVHDEHNDQFGELDTLLPDDAFHTYDISELIERISDSREFLELKAVYASNVITGLTRIGGLAVGIVASRPEISAGILDVPACRKIARFARMCRTLSLPVLKILDVPGFLPTAGEEHNGIAGEAAMTVSELSHLDSVTLVLRNAIGPAFLVLTASSGNDERLRWSGASIAPRHDHLAEDMGFTPIRPCESRNHVLAAFSRLRKNRSESRR